MTPTPAAGGRLSGAQWSVLALLCISVFINYVDRGNLSIAGPILMQRAPRGLGLDPAQLGHLLSAFFWTYALVQLVGIAGAVLDRFDVGWVYAAAFLLWSAATAASGLAGTFAVLFALRLLLGVGESVAYPAYSKIFATHFPEHHRGLANSLLDASSKLGPSLGTLIGGWLIARLGWRVPFLMLGAGSLLWLIPWMIWMPRGPGIVVARAEHAPPALVELLRQRSAWGTFGGLFCANYFWYFLLTWLPSYMVRERHFSMDRMATMGALAYLAIALSSAVSGWLSDRWIAAGATPTRVRKTFVAGGLLLSTAILPVVIVVNRDVAMALLFFSCIALGGCSSNIWAITQTLAGPAAAAKWTGIQNGVGNLAGVAAPVLTGWVVYRTGEFFWAFVVTTGILVASSCFYVFVVGPVRQVEWHGRVRTQF